MSGYLLDTNVISELRKPRPSRQVVDWIGARRGESLFVSRIALAEIRFGIELLVAGSDRRAGLEHWLEASVRPWFAGRVLEVDEDVLLAWRGMMEAGRARNRTFTEPDLLMAATARAHGLTVATRNVKDFSTMGVAVLNPWAPPA